jgi:hypothetical protein
MVNNDLNTLSLDQHIKHGGYALYAVTHMKQKLEKELQKKEQLLVRYVVSRNLPK